MAERAGKDKEVLKLDSDIFCNLIVVDEYEYGEKKTHTHTLTQTYTHTHKEKYL